MSENKKKQSAPVGGLKVKLVDGYLAGTHYVKILMVFNDVILYEIIHGPGKGRRFAMEHSARVFRHNYKAGAFEAATEEGGDPEL